MSNPATYVVPPTYEAKIHGFDYVEIGLRKAHLWKNGKRALSAFYKQDDLSRCIRFADWVAFIVKAQGA